ncbi:helix-turn-helix domain-containing protein [Acholeplasma laidlawii]|uniref:helix-turn-helix domain-containing protein n=1 Tax=Acholeplasma laidlawii TaxID=2148 RepID=UPI00084BED02|nr:helix-turn-helix transcriptional regulator [Acholeplasma laidlawii]OED58952.1 hypothetical protein BHS12_05535 [Acholeplasma laidlawii]
MTTGQRLAKLRKDHNYTQEELGELLDVSRQSISKWESDQAFPETQKLIELSKLYQTSVDYLLGNEKEHTQSNKGDSTHTNEPFKMTPKLFTMIWGVTYFVVMLLLYAVPILKVTITTDRFFGNIGFTINITSYDLLKNGPGDYGNFLVYLGLFALIAFTALSVFIFFTKHQRLYKIRRIVSIAEVTIWAIFTVSFIESIQLGIIFIILLTIINLISLFKVKNNLISTPISA